MERFGFNINFRLLPEDILNLGEAVLKNGEYGAIEVTYYEDMENIDTHAYNEAIRQIVKLYHPQVVVHISGFNASEENSVLRSAIIHEFRNCCKYTKELGGKEIVMHSGHLNGSLHVPVVSETGEFDRKEDAQKRVWELSVQMLRTCCDIAKEYGITVHTENLNGDTITLGCERVVQFVKDIDRENLDIVFDVGHCHHTGGKIAPEIALCGAQLKHLHIHDNFGEKDEHKAPGEGNIDYKEFCTALKQVGYNGLYMMEIGRCTIENLKSSRKLLLDILNEVG